MFSRRQPRFVFRFTRPAPLIIACAWCLDLLASANAVAAAPNYQSTDVTSAAPEVVIVTARRVKEDIQRVPQTVTALNASELRQQNITNIYDLTTAAPSLSVATEFNSLLPNFAVRGLATGVVTYFSEAPSIAAAAAGTPFMDIDSVQVLNGPQGTLFGRSSAAGAVLITPVHPDLDSASAFVSAAGGDYGRRQITGVVNYPLIEGELGLRIAANVNRVEGYTRLLGSSGTQDSIENQQVRVGLDFTNGAFENYLVASYLNVNQSESANVLTYANLDYPLYNLPPVAGPAVFGGVCAQSVDLGFSTDASSCIDQRVTRLGNIRPALERELTRVLGGHSAVRRTPAIYINGTPDFAKEREASLVDVASYDFGSVGPASLGIKNIFEFGSFQSNSAGLTPDGIGGLAEMSAAFTTGPMQSVVGSDNYVGSKITAHFSPAILRYVDDFQLHGEFGDGLLVGTVGGFFSYQDIPRDRSGTSNVYQVFSGVLTPDLGFGSASGFSAGGYTRETAVYTQETLDISRWGIAGLSVTAGYRYTWDKQHYKTYAAISNYSLSDFVPGSPGRIVPGASGSTGTSPSGHNYTVQVAEQVNSELMIYGSVSRAYVPGGTNLLGQTATDLPNYSSTYGPEIVLAQELGTKFNSQWGNVFGRFGADVYNNDYSDIVETFFGVVDGASVAYNQNIAKARLRGFEVYGTLSLGPAWEIQFSYNYNEAHYKKWVGEDPFSVAQPGDVDCVSTSPTGFCYLDLSNNPFPLMPERQMHLGLTYHVPIRASWGRINVSVTAYRQTREYYEAAAARDLELTPGVRRAISQPTYTLLNFRADWEDIANSGIDASLFVDNVADTTYATGKFSQAQTLGFAIANYGPPRMFGIEVSRRFGP